MHGGAGFEAEDFAHRKGRQHEAEAHGDGEGNEGAALELAEGLLDAQAALIDLRFVDGADLVGDAEHGLAARKDFVAEEDIAGAAALVGGPFEDGFEDFPVGVERLGKDAEGSDFGRPQKAAVFGDGLVHVGAGFAEAVAVAFGLAGFGFEEVVADVGAGDVDVAADAFEKAVAVKEVFADIVVGLLGLAERAHAVEFGEGHEGEETAEAADENQTAAHG